MMDWPEPDFKRFFGLVERLWPTTRVTPESLRGLWYKRYRGYSADEVKRTLENHRDEHPDATKPNWKMVTADLGLLKRGDANDFALHIATVRECGRDNERSDGFPGGRGLDDKSDAEVWAHWIRCNSPRYKMSEGVGDEPCVNAVCAGASGCGLTRRHCVGQHWEQSETHHWVKYLTDKGFPVPPYLTEPGVIGDVGPESPEIATETHRGALFGPMLPD